MKRLTTWNGEKYILLNPSTPGVGRTITDRMAAYENTGLEPDEINAIIIALGLERTKDGFRVKGVKA